MEISFVVEETKALPKDTTVDTNQRKHETCPWPGRLVLTTAADFIEVVF